MIDRNLLIAAAVICGCFGIAYDSYEDIYKATPDYSLQCIRQAAEHADSDGLTDRIDEKQIAVSLHRGAMAFRADQPQSGVLPQLAWLPITNELTDSLTLCINHELTQSPDTEDVERAQSVLSSQLQTMGMPLPVTGWHMASVSWSRRIDDTHAEITLHLSHPVLQQTIPCTIVMERTAPKAWHITDITQVSDLLIALQQAYEQALKKENEPIRKNIAAVLEIRDVSSSLVRSDDPDQVFLRMQYTPVFHQPRQDILEAKGVYELRRRTDQTLLFTAPVRLSLSSHATTRQSQFRLNPRIPAQEDLASCDTLDGMDSTLRLTSVTLRDGTAYTLQTTLTL